MNPIKRPLSVTLLAGLYLLVGTVGFVYHLGEILGRHKFGYGDFLVELTEFVAIVCGVFLLRGQNWARWLALAWMAFHVILSAFGAFREFAIHAVICALIAGILFQNAATQYFRGAPIAPPPDATS